MKREQKQFCCSSLDKDTCVFQHWQIFPRFFRCSVLAFEFFIKSIHDCNILVIRSHLTKKKKTIKRYKFPVKNHRFIYSFSVCCHFNSDSLRLCWFLFCTLLLPRAFHHTQNKKNKKRMKLQMEMPVDEDMLIWRQISFYFNVQIKVVCKRKHFPLSLLWMTAGLVTSVYELVYQNDDFRFHFGLDKHSKNRNKKNI